MHRKPEPKLDALNQAGKLSHMREVTPSGG